MATKQLDSKFDKAFLKFVRLQIRTKAPVRLEKKIIYDAVNPGIEKTFKFATGTVKFSFFLKSRLKVKLSLKNAMPGYADGTYAIDSTQISADEVLSAYLNKEAIKTSQKLAKAKGVC